MRLLAKKIISNAKSISRKKIKFFTKFEFSFFINNKTENN